MCIFCAILVPKIAQAEESLVPIGLDSAGGNYRLDTVMDTVGGTSSDGTTKVIHGFYFADELTGRQITGVSAIPEKRVPLLDNNSTYVLIEILPVGVPYAANQVLWSNEASGGGILQTNHAGQWSGTYEVDLPDGNYDFYATGLSALKRRISDYPLTEDTRLYFTADQNTVLTLPATATNSALLSGDAAILLDRDGSCGPSTVQCLVYSGDEWGDNYINGLDLSAIVNQLFVVDSSSAAILKEDLNKDGMVNGLDISISFNNLFKWGDQ